jgi:Sulfotransferase family
MTSEQPTLGKEPNLVFVVGCPRSGTTWLQKLLASHPAIRTGPETDIFSKYTGRAIHAFRADRNRPRLKGLQCYLSEAEFLELQRSFVLQALRKVLNPLRPGEIFLEKTPEHALYIGDIHGCFPQARFIHLLRDPRDVTASLLAAGRSWGSSWAPSTARAAGRMWTKYVSNARDAGATLPPSQFFEIRYERLLADTEAELKRCALFLSVGWDDTAVRAAVEQNRPGNLATGKGTPLIAPQRRTENRQEPIEPVGFVRSARSGSWVSDLSFLEKLSLWLVIRHHLESAGYRWGELEKFNPLADAVAYLDRAARQFRRSVARLARDRSLIASP